MRQYVPGLPWALQPDACVVLHDNTGICDEEGDAFMQENDVHHVRLPPLSANLMPVEGVFAELKKHVQDLVYANVQFLHDLMQLMAAAVRRWTLRQISGQLQRKANKVAELLL